MSRPKLKQKKNWSVWFKALNPLEVTSALDGHWVPRLRKCLMDCWGLQSEIRKSLCYLFYYYMIRPEIIKNTGYSLHWFVLADFIVFLYADDLFSLSIMVTHATPVCSVCLCHTAWVHEWSAEESKARLSKQACRDSLISLNEICLTRYAVV